MSKWFLGILIFAFSCQQKPECNLAETIFAKPNPDSSLILDLQNLWGSTDSIYNIVCESDLNAVFLNVNEKYFPFSNPEFLNMCSDVIYCGPPRRRDRVEVLINSKNDILMEREIIEIGDIDSFFQAVYLNPSKKPNL